MSFQNILKALLIVAVLLLFGATVYKYAQPVIGAGKWDIPIQDATDLLPMKRGDLVFWQSDSHVSNLLSQCLRHPFTHMSMVWHGHATDLSQVQVIDCDSHKGKHGVHIWPLKPKMEAWSGNHFALMRSRKPLSASDDRRLCDIASISSKKVTGFQMDTIYALNSLFMKSKTIHDVFKSRSSLFCSEFITYMLQFVGWVDRDIPRSFLTPVDYWNHEHGLSEYYKNPIVVDLDEALSLKAEEGSI
jgi:hypothetical protein